jgi:hypothetical protein
MNSKVGKELSIVILNVDKENEKIVAKYDNPNFVSAPKADDYYPRERTQRSNRNDQIRDKDIQIANTFGDFFTVSKKNKK